MYESRDHVGIMGAITPAGDFYTMRRPRSLKGPDSVWFLEHLHRQTGADLLVIWDRASIHRSAALHRFLAQGGARFVQLEALPAYAPELNPQEGMWHLLKDVELGNVCCWDLNHLSYELDLAVRRLRRRPELILSCFAQAKLEL